jgi:hypothetical protein
MDAEELVHKQALIKEHTRTLRELELQAARYSEFEVPVHVRKQITSVKEQIEELKAEIGIKTPKSSSRPRVPRFNDALGRDETMLRSRHQSIYPKPEIKPIYLQPVTPTLLERISSNPWLVLLITAAALVLYLMATEPRSPQTFWGGFASPTVTMQTPHPINGNMIGPSTPTAGISDR